MIFLSDRARKHFFRNFRKCLMLKFIFIYSKYSDFLIFPYSFQIFFYVLLNTKNRLPLYFYLNTVKYFMYHNYFRKSCQIHMLVIISRSPSCECDIFNALIFIFYLMLQVARNYLRQCENHSLNVRSHILK